MSVAAVTTISDGGTAAPGAGAVRGPLQTARVRPALEGVETAALDAALTSCADVVRTRARNFYYGLRLTPEPRRSAVYAIYAWMRSGDDRVDEQQDVATKRRELEAFRAGTRRALAAAERAATTGHAGDDFAGVEPFWIAFAATMRSYPIEPAHIWSMIDGLDEDIDHASYETMEQLDRYCFRVASTVGLVCTSVWGYAPGVGPTEAAGARVMAERLGRAFQLTNILRDFAQDYDQTPRRVYLPSAVLSSPELSLSAEELRAWADDARCRRAILHFAAIARGHYDAARGLEALLDPACRSTLWAMTRIYSGLLDQIVADPSRVVSSKRIRLSSARKLAISLIASARSKLGR